MSSKIRRTPRNYDGSGLTLRQVRDLAPMVLESIEERYGVRPARLLLEWPELIGPQLAPLTQAISFEDGVLYVKVKNSTLLSLLSQHEKPRLVSMLRKKFPAMVIKTIVFRVG